MGQPIYVKVKRYNGGITALVDGERELRTITEKQLLEYKNYLESEIVRADEVIRNTGGTAATKDILRDYPIFLERVKRII